MLLLLDKALSRLYTLCGAIAACAIVLIALLVATSIISRLLGIYVGGLTETAGYAMAAAGSFGLAYTFGSGGHIRVDLVLNIMPVTLRNIAEAIALLLTAAAIIFLAWYFARMVLISWDYGDLSDGSDELPLWMPQLPCALGFCIFAIALIHHLLKYLLTGHKPWVASANATTVSDDSRVS